jgi:hypothetical protein
LAEVWAYAAAEKAAARAGTRSEWLSFIPLLRVNHPPAVGPTAFGISAPEKRRGLGWSVADRILGFVVPTPGQSHEDSESRRATALKGHGLSRADFEVQNVPALAAEGCFWRDLEPSLRG